VRILFVSPRYYPHIGAVEYVMKFITERLVKEEHGVTVLTGEPRLNKHTKEREKDIHVIRWLMWPLGNVHTSHQSTERC